MFKRNSISAALAATLLGGFVGATDPAVAAEYSWQIAASGSRLDGAGGDSDSYTVDATYYVNRVDDGSGPYALASFFDPATRLSVTASRADGPSVGGVDAPTSYGFNGRYVWNDSGWYAGGGLSKTDVDDDPASPLRVTDPEGYSALVGKYLGPRTTLELAMGWSDSQTEAPLACVPPGAPCPNVTFRSDVDTRSTSLSAVHVRQFRSLTYALRGGVSETDVDVTHAITSSSGVFGTVPFVPDFRSDSRTYSVEAEFFPRRNLGIGVAYSRPEDFDSDGYSIDATWFFKPRVAVQMSVGRVSAPGATEDPETVGLRLVGRF